MPKHKEYLDQIRSSARERTIRLSGQVIRKKERAAGFFSKSGDFVLFCLKTFRKFFSLPFEGKEFLKQCFETGNKSFFLVSLTGMIMGLVLTIQSRPILEDFGAVSWLPGMVLKSVFREIGPVITALIFAGKVGSGIGAEIGSMRVTEQIDAMEVSAADPFKYLVVTRVAATTIMLPLLVYFSDIAGLIGSYIGLNLKSGINLHLFISQAFSTVQFSDIIPATLKSFVFGALIGLIGCYHGYNAGKGTESVGKAANSAVVVSSLSIFIVDVIVVQITDIIVSHHQM